MSTNEQQQVGRRALLGGTAAGIGAAIVGSGVSSAEAAATPGRGGSAGSVAGPPAPAPAPAAAAATATATATGVDWSAVQAQLAAVGPHVSAPISGVVTNKYTTGMLLGNGYFGAVVGDSSAAQQTYHFGFHSHWGNARNGTSWQNSILAASTLTVAAPGATAASGYSMKTDLAGAAVTTVLAFSGVKVTLRSWTADQDSVLVTEISSPAGSASITLSAQQIVASDAAYPSAGGVSNGAVWTTRQNNASAYSPTSLRSTVAAATKLVGSSYSSTSSTSVSGTGKFTLPGGGTVTLVTVLRAAAQDVSATTTMPSPTQLRDKAVTAAAAIDATWLTNAKATHTAFWQDFWTRSNIVVGDSQLETYYFNAQYVLGSATRAGANPPSLWGMWPTNDTPSWGGRYFLNYNEEALYYGAFSSNHADLSEPYRRLIYNEVPWQRNKTHSAGYQGTAFQRSLAPFHLYETAPSTTPVASTKDYTKLPADQKSNASFAALPLIWHWEYTRDQTYLQSQLYPLLKELDAFWRDFAVWDGSRWVFEHTSAHEGGDDTNPNLDLGFARKVINTLLETSVILGVDASLRPTWQDFLNKLSKYPTGTYNGVTVFYTAEVINNPQLPDKFEPGNQPINMEGVIFPGEQCSIGGDANLVQYAINSLAQMNSWGVTSGGNSNNGFPKEFPIAARVGWPAEDLFQKFKASIAHLWRSSNDTVFQGGGGIETTASTETLNSMLMQSEGGVIRVFPCWPTARNASFTLLAKGAFLVSSAISGGAVASVGITSQAGGNATLVLPWTTGTATVTADGSTVPVTVSGGRATFATTAGTTYKVTP
ncbi:glycosyl hydrolase family 95 catalytic domain-containing protein [Catenulispora subtropica]|uniref:Glycosyl hydrolase family 95 catalytic domain-containing protein n=1 Tax=Catenulispora subtropica TaxID=450798 RepID=A0ABN2S825_9ACTN